MEMGRMTDHFVGLYEISAQIGPTVYLLSLLNNMKIHNVFFIGLLKPYIQGNSTLSTLQLESVVIDGNRKLKVLKSIV